MSNLIGRSGVHSFMFLQRGRTKIKIKKRFVMQDAGM